MLKKQLNFQKLCIPNYLHKKSYLLINNILYFPHSVYAINILSKNTTNPGIIDFKSKNKWNNIILTVIGAKSTTPRATYLPKTNDKPTIKNTMPSTGFMQPVSSSAVRNAFAASGDSGIGKFRKLVTPKTNKIKPKIILKAKTTFLDVQPQSKLLKCVINIKAGKLKGSRKILRDISKIGHFGRGDYDFSIISLEDIKKSLDLIKHSYNINS